MKHLVLFISIISFTISTYAQKPRKFGKVTMDELDMKVYANDTTAKAVKIYDYGSSVIGYNDNFYVTLFVHQIIKIFEDDEFHRGDISISYPEGAKVLKLKAVTYNIDGGKVTKSELPKADIFDEKLTDGVMVRKFSMPDLNPGSIIEYSYSIKSGNLFSLNGWGFQSAIPIMWSEYRISYPLWFTYKILAAGYLTFDKNTRKDATFIIDGETITGTAHRYVITNAPAFKSEKYMTSRSNYIAKIDFELSAITIPPSANSSGYFKRFFSDFENIRFLLMEDFKFGKRLNDAGFLTSEIASIKSSNENNEEIINGLYSLLRNKVIWNRYYSLYAKTSARKVFAGEKANSAEINLLLVAIMREAGFEANPIIISTRNHGRVHPVYPLLKQYNHVICQVAFEGKKILLDATNKLIPFNMLPEYDLNGQGRLISENRTGWVKLGTNQFHEINVVYDFKLFDDGLLEGEATTTFKGYAAVNLRHKLEEDGIDKYKSSLASDGLEIEDLNFENVDKIESPIRQQISMVLESSTGGTGSVIYLSPILSDAIVDNPFKMDTRAYPVDYSYPRKTSLEFVYKVPEGYILEDKPENLDIKLPGQGGKYSYTVQFSGDILKVKSVFEISKITFLPREYKKLQSFYDQVITKQAEQVVFKKSTE